LNPYLVPRPLLQQPRTYYGTMDTVKKYRICKFQMLDQ